MYSPKTKSRLMNGSDTTDSEIGDEKSQESNEEEKKE